VVKNLTLGEHRWILGGIRKFMEDVKRTKDKNRSQEESQMIFQSHFYCFLLWIFEFLRKISVF